MREAKKLQAKRQEVGKLKRKSAREFQNMRDKINTKGVLKSKGEVRTVNMKRDWNVLFFAQFNPVKPFSGVIINFYHL